MVRVAASPTGPSIRANEATLTPGGDITPHKLGDTALIVASIASPTTRLMGRAATVTRVAEP